VFIWHAGSLIDTGVTGYPTDINNRGQIVGVSGVNPDGTPSAFLWDDGEVTYLAGSASSEAWEINEQSEIVGIVVSSGVAHAFVWRSGELTELPSLSSASESGQARGINNAGLIVGASANANGWSRATIWRDGSVIDLGTLGGPLTHSYAQAVNDNGQVVGDFTAEGGGSPSHAFLWEAGMMTGLGTLGGAAGATSINNRGWAVGTSTDGAGLSHAVLWIVK
jgi:probable HAF family extracellular repeat protein